MKHVFLVLAGAGLAYAAIVASASAADNVPCGFTGTETVGYEGVDNVYLFECDGSPSDLNPGGGPSTRDGSGGGANGGGRWLCKPADEIGDGPADTILFGYDAFERAQLRQLMRALLRAQRTGGAVYGCVRFAR